MFSLNKPFWGSEKPLEQYKTSDVHYWPYLCGKGRINHEMSADLDACMQVQLNKTLLLISYQAIEAMYG